MKMYNKNILKVFAFIFLIISTIILHDVINTNAKTINKEEYNYEDIKKYENILFLGDSITDWYPIEEIFGGMPIVRSGIAGYETKDILSRMDDMVYRYNPTKVFILIGTNDLKYKDSEPSKVAKDIEKIIENIKKNRKNTEIYVQSIYPVHTGMWAVEDRTNEKIKETNKSLKEYCEDNDIEFINMFDELTDGNGDLDEKYTKDGLHPNDLCYARMSQVLLKYIYNKE